MNDMIAPSNAGAEAQNAAALRLGKPGRGWRLRCYNVIFESDTSAGRRFDLCLIAAILPSILAVMLDSVHAVSVRHARLLNLLEWGFTLLFTAEYL